MTVCYSEKEREQRSGMIRVMDMHDIDGMGKKRYYRSMNDSTSSAVILEGLLVV